MASSHTPLIAGLAVLAALVVGLGYFVGRPPAPIEPPTEITVATPPGAAPTAEGAGGNVQLPVQPTSDETKIALSDPTKSTVAWPVKVRLELIQPAGIPRSSGMAPIGSAANATLAGSVHDGRDLGIPASVTFVAGPNEGRVLQTNSVGKFGASDLNPGLSVVEINGHGSFFSRREVRLRSGKETLLHLGFGMPGAVGGRVLDREDKPIVGATIQVDGQTAFSDLDGNFLLSTVPSGRDLECIVSKEGYASYFELVTVAARTANDKLVFNLFPGASLDVEIPAAVGGAGEATVVLMREDTWGQRNYPWRTKSPFRLAPGSRARIDDLPAGAKVRVYVFHTGAYANPPYQMALLREGAPQLASIQLEPAPVIVGTVRTRDGLVAQGAKVRLEAPDRVGSTVAYFEETSMLLESEVLPSFPMGLQETTSDHNGRFEFTSYPKVAPKRYVIAESADGSLSGARVIGPDEVVADVTIGPAGSGTAKLSIEFPGRHQAVPLECQVQGSPRDPHLLAAQEPYVIEGLAAGTWKLSATWHGQEIPMEAREGGPGVFLLEEETTQVIRLPRGAIDGQDEDTLLRSGRKN